MADNDPIRIAVRLWQRPEDAPECFGLRGKIPRHRTGLRLSVSDCVIQQRVVVEKVLPLSRGDLKETESQPDYIFEQPPQEIFNRLLPRYVEIQIYRALLESAASEHGARMASMDTASRNAGDMIDMLTLNMNRIRQAAITREIIEVVSGAGV